MPYNYSTLGLQVCLFLPDALSFEKTRNQWFVLLSVVYLTTVAGQNLSTVSKSTVCVNAWVLYCTYLYHALHFKHEKGLGLNYSVMFSG